MSGASQSAKEVRTEHGSHASPASQASRVWRVRYLCAEAAGSAVQVEPKHPGLYQHVDVLMAVDERELIRLIEARGGHVVRIEPLRRRPDLFMRVSNEYRTRLLMSVLFGVEGGLSPGRALEAVVEQEAGPMRERLNPALVVLRQGRGFMDALRATALFDEAVLTIVEAGEAMGKLPDAIRNACDHLGKSAGGQKLLIATMVAMGVDLMLSIGSVVGTRFGLIPYLSAQGVTSDDPAVKQEFDDALALASHGNDVLLVLAAFVALSVLWVVIAYVWGDAKTKAMAERVLLRVPLVRDLLVHSALASTAAVMSALLRGGVAFIGACDIAARGSKVALVTQFWRGAGARVEMGDRVGESLAHAPLDPSEQMVVMSHKDAQHLAKTFELVSEQRREKASRTHKKLAGALVAMAMTYSSVSVLLAVFVLYVQNRAAMGG